MITAKLYAALAHVASQILDKWVPVSVKRSSEQVDRFSADFQHIHDSPEYAGLNVGAWLELLEQDVSSFDPWLPWLPKVLEQRKVSLSDLAESAARHFSAISDAGAHYASIYDWNYPKLLKHIARPPLGLTIIGNDEVLCQPSIAVIGSRRPSYEALKMSVEVGIACARAGLGIVSGGAIGCDIAAHEGMLVSDREQIKPIVVQAGGLSCLFPKSNLMAFSEILQRGGAIISERLWFQMARPHDFPSRNRIVSGMCEVTIVMAAAPKSGSLITASEALEQGRDVYVFSHADGDARSEGSMQLLKEGATPFLSASELMEVLSLNYETLSHIAQSELSNYCQEVVNVGTFNTAIR